jgi:hypothetical protein
MAGTLITVNMDASSYHFFNYGHHGLSLVTFPYSYNFPVTNSPQPVLNTIYQQCNFIKA